jgi:hypothetical protein
MNIVSIMHNITTTKRTTTNSKFKRIVVSENIYQKLKNLGKAGDSFNDVLVRTLAKIEQE